MLSKAEEGADEIRDLTAFGLGKLEKRKYLSKRTHKSK